MKEKQNKDDNARLKDLVNLYPKSARTLAGTIAKLKTDVKVSRTELSARHHIKVAQTMHQLWSTPSDTSNQNQQVAIITLEGGMPIHVTDDPLLGEYVVGFYNVKYINKEYALFDAAQETIEQGGVHFQFYNGLPECQLYFWVTWGYSGEEAKFKIGCDVFAAPINSIEPNQFIEKYTIQENGFMAGFDMKWTVDSANDYADFHIKNSSGKYIFHYYTTMLALLP